VTARAGHYPKLLSTQVQYGDDPISNVEQVVAVWVAEA